MKYDLSIIGIYSDLQYECIYTTINSKKEKNSGAFAFIYLGDDKVMCRIFEGSQTLKNIQDCKHHTRPLDIYRINNFKTRFPLLYRR